jgi:hypothetical protein
MHAFHHPQTLIPLGGVVGFFWLFFFVRKNTVRYIEASDTEVHLIHYALRLSVNLLV